MCAVRHCRPCASPAIQTSEEDGSDTDFYADDHDVQPTQIAIGGVAYWVTGLLGCSPPTFKNGTKPTHFVAANFIISKPNDSI
jgi:hypothetical protein